MPEKLRPSFSATAETVEALKKLIPEAFKDGFLDFEALQDALSGYTGEVSSDDKHFGLYWPGKKEAKRAAVIPARGSLVPVPGDGVNENTTKNIYIEGDNLEVLKLLLKSYAGRVKMIYIDPPYNTGNDFVYKDNFSETAEEYWLKTGQIDENGVATTTNKSAGGRFHSNWCSMMYPRLRLAQEFLSEDGVIFISIDDNEVAHLRKICDEIFGDENFVGDFVWKKKGGAGNTERILGNITEFIVCYAKQKAQGIFNYRKIEREYKFFDKIGEYNVEGIEKTNDGMYERKTMQFAIVDPKTGKEFYPSEGKRWTIGEKTCAEFIEQGKLLFDYENGKVKRIKRPKDYEESENVFLNLLLEHGSLSTAKDEVKDLIGVREAFETPKPLDLLIQFIEIASEKDSLILDFFSGSATTAHAVMQLNAEDGGNRQFIMAQLPELCDEKSEAAKAGFKNICEIGKERIRRAGKKILQDFGEKAKNLDTGFKVFRLASSNYKKWQNYTGTSIKEAEDMFSKFENPLIDGWKPENLITEIMLLEGFPLDSEITSLKTYAKNKVQQVSSNFCEHNLFVCLDREIHADTIKALTLKDNDIFICLDNAITDQDKMRLDDKQGRIKTI